MTTLATHPAAEDLGRFIDGMLDSTSRAAIVEHLADCDECRITVVDVTAFGEELAPPYRVNGRWAAIAAAIAIMVGGAFIVNARRDPLAPVIEASTHLNSRLVDARLSGFPHVAPKQRNRGSSGEIDSAAYVLEGKAADVLSRRGDDPRMQHAKGVALLLRTQAELADHAADDGELAKKERDDLVADRDRAIALLREAANRASDKPGYRSDLAAALIAKGDAKSLDLAVAACKQALGIDRYSRDALFNLALALRDPDKAKAAYQNYLAVDSTSGWAKEARQAISRLE